MTYDVSGCPKLPWGKAKCHPRPRTALSRTFKNDLRVTYDDIDVKKLGRAQKNELKSDRQRPNMLWQQTTRTLRNKSSTSSWASTFTPKPMRWRISDKTLFFLVGKEVISGRRNKNTYAWYVLTGLRSNGDASCLRRFGDSAVGPPQNMTNYVLRLLRVTCYYA